MTNQRNLVEHSVYDFAKNEKELFSTRPSSHCDIYIDVNKQSYLKYLITLVNRAGGINLKIEELHTNTFNKIQSHVALNFFKKSLENVSGKTNGDVSVGVLREWFRLCFFANNGKTIADYIGNKPENCYIVDFEIFFSQIKIKNCAVDIINHFNLKPQVVDIDDVIDEFFNKKYYKNHINTDNVKNSIQQNQNIGLNLNLIEQAWLDNWLVEQYNIHPQLSNEYFNNTQDLIDFYNLPVDNN